MGEAQPIAPGGIQVEAPGGTVIVVTPGWWEAHQVWYLNIDAHHVRATQGIMGWVAPNNWLPALPDGKMLGPGLAICGSATTTSTRSSETPGESRVQRAFSTTLPGLPPKRSPSRGGQAIPEPSACSVLAKARAARRQGSCPIMWPSGCAAAFLTRIGWPTASRTWWRLEIRDLPEPTSSPIRSIATNRPRP